MYKSKLQEVCQERLWTNPNYTYSKDGSDHKPQFKASVIINGISFHSPHFCKSSKEAQNEAARIAFHHFITSSTITANSFPVSDVLSSRDSSSARNYSSGKGALLPDNEEISNNTLIHGNASVVKDDQDFRDVHRMYKSQLQNYAQKTSLSAPVYSCVREGSHHDLRFKAMVAVGGQTFESPEFFRTLKEAEHAAAKAAFSSLSKDGILEDDCGLYKNLLQELTGREGFSIPIYTTSKTYASSVPLFTSSVGVEGDVFHGVAAKTKKQAEINAAKVAFLSLKERQLSRITATLSQDIDFQKALDSIYSSTLSTITQQKLNLEAEGDNKVADASEVIANRVEVRADHYLNPENGSKLGNRGSSSSDISCEREPVQAPWVLSSQDGSSSPTTVLECSDCEVTRQNTDQPAAAYTLLCNRVRVYPCKPNLKFPKGVTVLPVCDDKWIAVSLEYPN
ncbi:Double-stranded rna-binding protein [Thalictrum thalictroides]|uniref:Double-stranded rna-binding protein n=1 Tax=Thalictrum thalictroides TaxID=46969 RepID=A0A7J6VG21_THATH|nr:Double-stranded rna-binding protein [Thalictrum thalictroides]